MAFTEVTLTATFETGEGDPARGRLRFTPSEPMTNDSITIAAAPVTATLDGSGEISIVLAATTDATTTTQSGDPAVYLVEELLVGQRPRSYRIALVHTDTTQDLVDITPEA